MAGKGSRPRPLSVDYQTFSNNWDRVFLKQVNNKDKENQPVKSDDKQPTGRSSVVPNSTTNRPAN